MNIIILINKWFILYISSSDEALIMYHFGLMIAFINFFCFILEESVPPYCLSIFEIVRSNSQRGWIMLYLEICNTYILDMNKKPMS